MAAARTRQVVLWTGLVLLAAYSLRRPPVPALGPGLDFSLERAQAHVRAIASERHPVGSEAHARVAAYIESQIRSAGLTPEIQETTAVSRWGELVAAAAVRNIAVRVPGTASTGALVLAAHYDSVPSGPGASDDGHGVAVLLEALRAIHSGPPPPAPPRNDLVFLFSDAEECGLAGAVAFERDNPLREGVRVVVNFEARGTGEPPAMFETSEQNGWLIGELAAAVPAVQAGSVYYEIYRRLPNDTDLTVFKRAGRSGMNFAFIGHPEFYHTPYDDAAHLDPESLRAAGVYAVALARRLGDADLRNARAPNAVYFPTGLTPLVRYPETWVVPLAALAVLGLGVAFTVAARRRAITLGSVLSGAAAVPLLMAAAFGLTWAVWAAATWIYPQYQTGNYGFTYNAGYYYAAALALTAAVFFPLIAWLGRAGRLAGVAAGALLWPAAFLVALVALAPGASYLLEWPLLFSALALVLEASSAGSRSGSPLRALALVLAGAPALILLAPSLKAAQTALGMRLAPALACGFVVLLVLLLPQFAIGLAHIRPSRLAIPPLILCLALLVAGSATAGFSVEHPKPNQAAYALDASSGKAWWLGRPDAMDPWLEQFFGQTPRPQPAEDFLPFPDVRLWRAPAPLAELPAPRLEVLGDDLDDAGVRRLELRLTVAPTAGVRMLAAANGRFSCETINGLSCAVGPALRRASGPNIPAVIWFGPGEAPLTLVLRASSREPLVLRALSVSPGLPNLPPGISPRPREPWMMEAAGGWLSGTAVARSFPLPPAAR